MTRLRSITAGRASGSRLSGVCRQRGDAETRCDRYLSPARLRRRRFFRSRQAVIGAISAVRRGSRREAPRAQAASALVLALGRLAAGRGIREGSSRFSPTCARSRHRVASSGGPGGACISSCLLEPEAARRRPRVERWPDLPPGDCLHAQPACLHAETNRQREQRLSVARGHSNLQPGDLVKATATSRSNSQRPR